MLSYPGCHLCRVRVLKIKIVINCNLLTFSKVIACNHNSDVSLITVIKCNKLQGKNGRINNNFQLLFNYFSYLISYDIQSPKVIIDTSDIAKFVVFS